jgi:hypothetical protein
MYKQLGAVYNPRVARGSGSHAIVVAPMHKRYVGMYYWCSYWHKWDKILDVNDRQWTVQGVDNDGNPLLGDEGRVRTHATSMEACHFADRPFVIKPRRDPDAILYRAKETNKDFHYLEEGKHVTYDGD